MIGMSIFKCSSSAHKLFRVSSTYEVLKYQLTMYTDVDPFADGGRDPITRDTQVCAHLRTRYLRQLQHFTLVC